MKKIPIQFDKPVEFNVPVRKGPSPDTEPVPDDVLMLLPPPAEKTSETPGQHAK